MQHRTEFSYYSALPIGLNGSIAVFNGTNFSGSHMNYAESTDGEILSHLCRSKQHAAMSSTAAHLRVWLGSDHVIL